MIRSALLRFALLCAAMGIFPAGAEMGSSKVSRLGPYEVKQLVTPGFDSLPLRRRMFVYALAEAFSAAEDIAWLQMSREGLDVRHLLERIWEKNHLLTPQQKGALSAYYFEILMHNGIYDTYNNQKYMVEGLSEGEFRTLLAQLKIEPPANLDTLLQVMFDPYYKSHFKAVTGQDLVLDSGSNFYGEGLRERDIKALGEDFSAHTHNYPQLSSLTTNRPRVRVLRTRGMYGRYLKQLVALLDNAKAFGEPQEVRLIEAYQKALRTGSPRDWIEADRLWLRTKPKDIDFSFGFIETYDDPLGRIGTFQASIVLLANSEPESQRRSEALLKATGIYESLMPVEERFKQKGEVNPPQAEGAHLLFWVGGGSAGGPLGFNLPNNAELRRDEGSRSYTLLNKANNIGSNGPEIPEEDMNSFYRPEYHGVLRRHGKFLPSMVHVEFHEVLGHGSGKNDPGINPEEQFGKLFNPMEEGRAEVAAIYHVLDYQNLVDLKILPAHYDTEAAREFALSRVLQFFTDHIISYHRLEGGHEVRQAHMVGRQIMLNWALRDGALKVVPSAKGVPQIEVADLGQLRASMGTLFGRLQLLKSTGDKAALQELIESNWNLTPEQLEWARAVKKALDELNKPKHALYLNPHFALKKNEAGEVINVSLVYEAPAQGLDVGLNHEHKRLTDQAKKQGDCVTQLTIAR